MASAGVIRSEYLPNCNIQQHMVSLDLLLGDAFDIALAHRHGHRNGPGRRCIFSVVDFMSWCITVAKQPCYGRLKIKPSYNIVCCYVLIKFIYYDGPPTAMNAVLAIIANGGQAIVVIDREALEINYFLL